MEDNEGQCDASACGRRVWWKSWRPELVAEVADVPAERVSLASRGRPHARGAEEHTRVFQTGWIRPKRPV